MPITTNNTDYYDDFSVGEIDTEKTPDDKNYLRILFKPGYSVQVRELNQMQSILQSQIDKFGQSVWRDGVAVIGGNANFDDNISTVTVVGSGGIELNDDIVKSILSVSGDGNNLINLTADVIGYQLESEGVYKLYIRYKNSVVINGTGNISTFAFNDNCSATGTGPETINITVTEIGHAAGVFLDKSIFFTKGCFVATPSQKVFIDKEFFDSKTNGFAKIRVIENYINSDDDNTLLDNANGSLNSKAPGADRYQIDLELFFVDVDITPTEDSTINLITIANSEVVEIIRDKYTSIDVELAKRTFEESGNYTLSPFKLQIRELFKDQEENSPYNGGRYEASQLDDAGIKQEGIKSPSDVAKGKYYAGLDSSIAYVNGFRVESISKSELYADKAREPSEFFVDSNVRANIGNYCVGSFAANSRLPRINSSLSIYEIGITKTVIDNISDNIDAPILRFDSVEELTVGMKITGSIFAADTTITNITRSTNRITLDKALILNNLNATVSRTNGSSTATFNVASHNLTTGQLIIIPASQPIVTGVYGVTVINATTFTIQTVATTAISSGTSVDYKTLVPNTEAASFVAGTTIIKAVESAGVIESVQNYRFYLYDTIITAPNGFNISYISYIKGKDNDNINVNINVNVPITAINENTNIFKLPYNAIKDVKKVQYNSLLYFINNTITEGSDVTIQIDLPANHSVQDLSPNSFIVNVAGIIYTPTNITRNIEGTKITLKGNWSAGLFNCIVQTKVAGESAITKTLLNAIPEVKLGTAAISNVFTLNNAQILPKSLKVNYGAANGPDVTSNFNIIDDGQRDNYYTNVRVQYNGPKLLTEDDSFYFTYKFFANSAQVGFATVKSYEDQVSYSDIPSYKGIRLTDVIDFRPVILSGAQGTSLKVLDPYSDIISEAQYYLPKIDKIVVSSDSKFSIVSGTPSLNPVEPVTPSNSMALYTLSVPAYTHNVSDIVINYINNRRYTMSDIGSLDRRISNIEYYTTLSLLEKSANDKPISDVVETRFKNGIIVDSFVDFSSADNANPAFKSSMDVLEGILRPSFDTTRIDFKPNEAEGISINTNTVTLEYEEKEYINQKFASEIESVNPYDIATYVGTVALTPSSDEWIETKRIVTNVFDANTTNIALAQPLEGEVWNNWVTTGREGNKAIQTKTGVNRTLQIVDVGTETLNRLDISSIPFIRSRKIYFSAQNLKPNTQVYPFFDGFDISDYVNTLSYIEFGRSKDVATYNGKTAAQAGIVKTSCVTNNAGAVTGMILIPNNSNLRFKTGVRQFKLTDSPVNNPIFETTYASADYTAFGQNTTINSTITTTRTPQIVERNITATRKIHKDPIAQSFLIDNTSPAGVFLSSVDLYFQKRSESLPVTVSIVTMENGYPSQNVVPFSEVTLNPYEFNVDGSYDTNNPIIQISDDATVETKFTFSDPVYLNPGNEYALVVTSNDAEYHIWVAKVGGKNVGVASGTFIEKNVYSGVMFMSANSSTWTADQNRDFKFVLYRAEFGSFGADVLFKPNISSGVQSVTITNPGSGYTNVTPPTVAFDAPITVEGVTGVTATGTAVIDNVTTSIIGVTITDPGFGYTTTPTVAFGAPTSAGGFLATGTVNMVNIPITTFNFTQNNIEPYSTGTDNSDSATKIFNTLKLDTNKNFSILPDENYDLKLQYNIDFTNKDFIDLTTDFSTVNNYVSPLIDLDNVSLLAISNVMGTPDALINDNTATGIAALATTANDTNNVNITYRGTGYNVAPAVTFSDPPSGSGATRTGTTTIDDQGRVIGVTIIDPGFGYTTAPTVTFESPPIRFTDTETLADAGNGLSRYITRTVNLNQPADRLNVFVDVNRPVPGSYIKMYVKLKQDNLSDSWYEMIPKNGTTIAPQNGIPVSSDPTNFSEVEYVYKSPNNDFFAFAVKIVFVSETLFNPTTVKNFRAIATSGIE